MLPTKGYFQDIECPYFDNSCGRPYCHFRHKKKQTDSENTNGETASQDVPTYTPTPKSELAVSRSHIPISYVPDIIYRTEKTSRPLKTTAFKKPIYNPTPISLLTSAAKEDAASNHIKDNIANTRYSPKGEKETEFRYEPTSLEDNETLSKNSKAQQYQPVGEKSSKVAYNPTSLNEIVKPDSADVVYKPIGKTDPQLDYKPSPNLVDESGFDFGNLDTEFNMIDEIIMSDCGKPGQEANETDVKSTVDKKDASKSSNESHKHKHKDKKSHKTKSESRHKSSSKEKKSSKEENDRSKERSKESRHKDKKKSKDENKHRKEEQKKSHEKESRSKSKKSKHRHSSDDKNKHRSSEKKNKDKSPQREVPNLFSDNEDDNGCLFDADLDMDSADEMTMQECYKIFYEYTPAKIETVDIKPPEPTVEETEQLIPNKKRIAHSNVPCSSSAKLQPAAKPKILPTPGLIMNNRFKLAKEMQASDEAKLIENEVKLSIKRPPATSLISEIHKKLKLQAPKPQSNLSLVEDIINGNKTKTTMKKIAPVANVMSIQRAKAQLEELNKKRASEQINKTVAQTNKFGKRQAHIPEIALDDIPDVKDAGKSKLPVNVRTRYLTMLAEESCKLYLARSDAHKRAIEEEYSCYQKCKVLVSYRNSAMLAVNRLRKEIRDRESKNLGPIGAEESSNKANEDSERLALYKRIQRYALSEEELDIHGYPRESKIPGKAIIKNRKSVSTVPLPRNQRKCSRCSKIYLVDNFGKVVYQEECLYHPLKKRTIRGEHVHLCCKSTDDSGCVTSHTHVSEMSEDAELEGFQTTMPPDSQDDPRSRSVYALDCEMCYTTKGLELTRVTIVDINCKTVYESLVKPLSEIIDYNTRFSGITKQQMDRINTGILQVQANILHLCNSQTILIGHSLESDMKALKIVHGTIVDTSVLFPHKMGLPHKKALKSLASEYLKKIIQNDAGGHDSAEDAITCMELVKWKVKEDSKFKFIK